LSAFRCYPCRLPPSGPAERRNPRAVPVLPSGKWIATLLLQRREEVLALPAGVLLRLKDQAAARPRAH
jgi:hypothetical protein